MNDNNKKIRENITPRGDGNSTPLKSVLVVVLSLIRENITPRGDGNYNFYSHGYLFSNVIRENITPRGDGNLCIHLIGYITFI